MSEEEKENIMLCNGSMPSQMVQIMEMHQAYVNGMINFYQIWLAISGVGYWQEQYLKSMKDQSK